MKNKKSDLNKLSGKVDKVLYRNKENGFSILRLSDEKGVNFTATGKMPDIYAAENINLKGRWIKNPKYGIQFSVVEYEKTAPTSLEGIEKYLSSGLVPGIGPVMAKRIVEKFKEKSLDIIENSPQMLKRVEGLGTKRISWIKNAWNEQREIREVMIFLQGYGVSSGYAVKIFKKYGSGAIKIIKQNPYRLASDIQGIGFVRADRIAKKLGFEKDSIVRAESGILYFLQTCVQEGHLYFPKSRLKKRVTQMLAVSGEIIQEALENLLDSEKIHIEDSITHDGAVYESKFYRYEKTIALHLRKMLGERELFKLYEEKTPIEIIEEKLSIKLAPQQIEAVKAAGEHKLMVITGGPGTGKTTIISAIIAKYFSEGKEIQLAAPTGRAAKRMSEATGHPAKTIHRLLEFSFEKGGFQRNAQNPLSCDILVIDEASMIDTILMHDLIRAVPNETTLILVGDADQLPPVGPGSVLKDIIESARVPVIKLNEVFRQASKSLIVVNAHRINSGQMPLKELKPAGLLDFYFIESNDDEKILEIILKLAAERIPKRFKLDSMSDIQVITPMHKGLLGSENLNRKLQEKLNNQGNELVRGKRHFRCGDKVMQIKNNYEKEVFNGDIGFIEDIDQASKEVLVSFDGRIVPYLEADLEELMGAYAISVHKSQGSEYPAIILPLAMQHYIMLQRNLVYTALTRAKSLAVFVGSRKALSIAVNNNRGGERYTGLKEYIRAEANS
ncbi:MAG: ATP-dependent RecD-like DNA helicase [Elusimicrobia bacterium]|nr:ATP-dependent RecD-like DNA helicase [Elusimicrobiota bacterium]